jgi:hypothetical protein
MSVKGPGRPKKPKPPEKLLDDILPVSDIFNDAELEIYRRYIEAYKSDFDDSELTYSDVDDIVDLAKNKVLEYRLLREAKDDTDRQLDITAAIEKLSKKNEKIKESLSTRRKDRINPNDLKGFSIVDLAVAYDNEVKLAHEERMKRMRRSEEEMLEKRKDFTGNRYDRYEDTKEGDQP